MIMVRVKIGLGLGLGLVLGLGLGLSYWLGLGLGLDYVDVERFADVDSFLRSLFSLFLGSVVLALSFWLSLLCRVFSAIFSRHCLIGSVQHWS